MRNGTQVPDLRVDDSIPDNEKRLLETWLLRYFEAQQAYQEAEKALKDCRDRVSSIMVDAGISNTRYESYSVSLDYRERRTISREKLIANGVNPEVISRSETVTHYTVLDIRDTNRRRNLDTGKAQ